MKKLILSTMLLLGLTSPTWAQENETAPEVQRFGLEAGLGTNLILPFLHAKFSYRLPTLEDRLDLFADYSFFNTAFETQTQQQIALFGLKYYFETQERIRPWVALAAGYSFLIGGPVVGNPNFVEITSFEGFMAELGIGTDLMFSPNLGISTAFYINSPFVFRPEVNFKWAF